MWCFLILVGVVFFFSCSDFVNRIPAIERNNKERYCIPPAIISSCEIEQHMQISMEKKFILRHGHSTSTQLFESILISQILNICCTLRGCCCCVFRLWFSCVWWIKKFACFAFRQSSSALISFDDMSMIWVEGTPTNE